LRMTGSWAAQRKTAVMWDSGNDEYSTTVNTTEWAPEAEEMFVTSTVMKEEREPVLPSKLTTDRVVLKCSDMGCRLGPGGTRWLTPSLPVTAAVELVLDHVEDYHVVDVDYPGVEDDWIMGCPEEN
jgi:hypothetical protein